MILKIERERGVDWIGREEEREGIRQTCRLYV